MPKTNGNNVGGVLHRQKPKIRKAAPQPPAWHVRADKKDAIDLKDPRFKHAKPPKKNKGDVIDHTGNSNHSTHQDNTSNNSSNSQTFVIGESEIGMMRAKTISFVAEGLKPNTQYYPFLDDVYVGDFCSAVDSPGVNSITGKVSNPDNIVLKTNDAGDIVGNFFMPGNTFATGTHTFKLVDDVDAVDGTIVPTPVYGSAEATYESHGVLKQLQTQVTNEVVEPDPPTPVVDPKPQPTVDQHVDPIPVVECETWYFEYKVGSTETKTFTITTNSSTPPAETPSPKTGGSVIAGSVVYISTSSRNEDSKNTRYDHKYSYSSSTNHGTGYRQEWVGHTVTDAATELPLLTSFRPSGIKTTDSVTITKTWTKVGKVACPVKLGLKTPVRHDPLAQSFFVDAAQYPNGMFATSIGVYFKNVDHTTAVTLELREMANGLPSSDILPGGSCYVQGFQASSSVDASVATIFRFDTPVYLQPSTDYCFVLKSTSMGYNAWCSRVGEIDVTTQAAIDDGAFVGTLFKSENDVTWVPDMYEDIKFDLYKADFNTGASGELHFRPAGDGRDTDKGYSLQAPVTPVSKYWGTAQVLPMSYISTTKGSNKIAINIPLHGLVGGDYITIEGIADPVPTDAYNGIPATALNGQHVIDYVDEDNITVDLTGGVTASKTGHIQVSDIYTMFDNHPTQVFMGHAGGQDAIQVVDYGTISPSAIMSQESIDAAKANRIDRIMPIFGSSTSFKVYTNIVVNEVMVDYMGTELEMTSLTEAVQLSSPSSYQKATFDVEHNEDFLAFSTPRLIPSLKNESIKHTALGDGCDIAVTLQSGHKDISPVVDVNGASLLVRSYKIDNQGGELTSLATLNDFNDPTKNSEIKSGTGNAAAKYKSTINVLGNVYNKMTVFVTANCPDPAIFDVYVRTSTDKTTHMDLNWTWVPVKGVFGTAFVPSQDNKAIGEWMYVINSSEPFDVFDVKVVMRSTNSSVVPKIYGVRTIADNI